MVVEAQGGVSLVFWDVGFAWFCWEGFGIFFAFWLFKEASQRVVNLGILRSKKADMWGFIFKMSMSTEKSMIGLDAFPIIEKTNHLHFLGFKLISSEYFYPKDQLWAKL